jgi:small-conductance mechanosensitive channel
MGWLAILVGLGILCAGLSHAQRATPPGAPAPSQASAPSALEESAGESTIAKSAPETADEASIDSVTVPSDSQARVERAYTRLDEIPQERNRLELLVEAAERELKSLDLRLQNASARYASLASPSTALLDEVEMLQLERDAKAQQIAALEDRLVRLDRREGVWRRVIEMQGDRASGTVMSEWQDEAVQTASRLERALIQRRGRLEDLETKYSTLRSRLANEDLPGPKRESLERRQDVIEGLIAFHREDASDIEEVTALEQSFAAELDAKLGEASLLEQIQIFWSRATDLWGYEITVVDGDPITVGNAFLALLLIGLGLSVSRRISRSLRSFFERRFRLDPGVAAALETAAFYVLVVSFGLIALRTVNFPLTAFTVAGGALAIGIGFGSQNVMNNFISGLILMLERPIRGQDLVELEGNHGVVERIGARSTRIRATDGRHVIVPNSFFLESNVVNWTLSDDLIRAKLAVGVIYGSPTRLVEKLIRQALDENSKILASPEPIIIFSDFGNDALIFEAYFWLKARGPMAVETVKSQVRFRIDDLFREHDLVIAFPQRDVHLDSVPPIEIRLTGNGRPESPSESSKA